MHAASCNHFSTAQGGEETQAQRNGPGLSVAEPVLVSGAVCVKALQNHVDSTDIRFIKHPALPWNCCVCCVCCVCCPLYSLASRSPSCRVLRTCPQTILQMSMRPGQEAEKGLLEPHPRPSGSPFPSPVSLQVANLPVRAQHRTGSMLCQSTSHDPHPGSSSSSVPRPPQGIKR